MHPQRQSALSLAALAISLLSCQFAQEPASLPAVGAAPLPAVVEAAPQPSSQEVARLADAVRSEAARFGLAPDLEVYGLDHRAD